MCGDYLVAALLEMTREPLGLGRKMTSLKLKNLKDYR